MYRTIKLWSVNGLNIAADKAEEAIQLAREATGMEFVLQSVNQVRNEDGEPILVLWVDEPKGPVIEHEGRRFEAVAMPRNPDFEGPETVEEDNPKETTPREQVADIGEKAARATMDAAAKELQEKHDKGLINLWPDNPAVLKPSDANRSAL